MLSTDRLLLRAWFPTDRDFVFDMYSRWEVQQYLGASPRLMADRGEADRAIAAWQGLRGDSVLGVWAITLADDGRPLGNVFLKSIPASADSVPLPDSGDIEIGWHLHPDAWGHGYATEAAGAILRRGLRSGLPLVVAVTYPANTPSQRVAERIGMRHQGRSRKYYNLDCELFTATPGDISS